MTYTPVGLIASITDAQNNVTSYQYDAHGNRTRVATRKRLHIDPFSYPRDVTENSLAIRGQGSRHSRLLQRRNTEEFA
jgi:YD repeat-containing protein